MIRYVSFATKIPRFRPRSNKRKFNSPTRDELLPNARPLWHIGVGVYERRGLLDIALRDVYFRKFQDDSSVGGFERGRKKSYRPFKPENGYLDKIHPVKGTVQRIDFKRIPLEAIVDISQEEYEEVKKAYEDNICQGLASPKVI